MSSAAQDETRLRCAIEAYQNLRPSPKEFADEANISLSLLEKVGKGRQKATAHTLKMMSTPLLSRGRLLIHSGRVLKALAETEADSAVDLVLSPWSKVLLAGSPIEEVLGWTSDQLVGNHLDWLCDMPPTLSDEDEPQTVVCWSSEGRPVIGWAVVSPTDTPPECDWYVTLLFRRESDS
jgi:hypothetical protein